MYKLQTKNIIIIIFTIVSSYLAITDTDFRKDYSFLVSTAIGGYLGQLIPQNKEKNWYDNNN